MKLVIYQVEDIVDTGNTISSLIALLKSKGASSISVCTLLDKPARRTVNFELVGKGKFYCGFEVLSLSLCFSFSRALGIQFHGVAFSNG